MKNTRLVQLLKSFNGNELREFGKFLNSPFHNSSRKLVEFYEILKSSYPKFSSKSILQENVYTKLFPGRKFGGAQMRNMVHELTLQLENFLAHIEFHSDQIQFKRHLLSQLAARDSEILFEKNFKFAVQTLEDLGIKDEEYYLNMYLLESLRKNYYDRKTPIGKRKTIYDEISKELDHVLYFFFVEILKGYFTMYSGKRLLNFDYKFKFFEEIMSYLSKEIQNYKDCSMITLLYNFMILYRNDEEELAGKVKEIIDSNRKSMTEDDYRFFYTELYHYYKLRQSEGDKSCGRKSFRLLNEMLKNNVPLQKDGTMAVQAYINLAAAGLRENELNWAEKFINDYRDLVPPEQRENAYLYNYAVLYYIKGTKSQGKARTKNFGMALDYLSRVKSEDFYYMTRIKNLLIKIYFELGELDLTLYLIHSYKSYLSKTKLIPENLLERYNNFVNFTQKLVRIKKGTEDFPLRKLKKELVNTAKVEYKGWLLRKIEELETVSVRSS